MTFIHFGCDRILSELAAEASGVQITGRGHSGNKLEAPELKHRLEYWVQYEKFSERVDKGPQPVSDTGSYVGSSPTALTG